MASSRASVSTFEQQAVDLAWGAWVELGVPGADRTHQDWAIDPEPLILFTAFLGDTDGRLRDEATDWCIRSWRSVSKNRLRRLLAESPADVVEGFGVLAATVNERAGITWPGATDSRPHRTSGRPRPPVDLTRESMAWLRLRTIFGMSARAEVLRYFLPRSTVYVSAAMIARRTGYTKRSIAEEAENLAEAGVLGAQRSQHAHLYTLERRQALEDLVGKLPLYMPDWADYFAIARELVLVERAIGRPGALPASVPVKALGALEAMEPAIDHLRLVAPASGLRGADLWPAVRDFGKDTLGKWAAGRGTPVARQIGMEALVRRVL